MPATFQLATTFSLSAELAGTGDSEELFEQTDDRRVDLSSVGNVFGFHGLPKDPETGLVYVRNRYYDPELGRFISADPMGYVDGPSMYQFAGYSPVNFSDPLGLQHDIQYPIWQAEHPSPFPKPEDTVWSSVDLIRWLMAGFLQPGSKGRAYLFRFKEKWVREYRELIKLSAATNDLPARLVGGIAYQEVGGDPYFFDDAAYWARSHGLLRDKPRLLTSFGDVSIQLRRAAETLGLDPQTLSDADIEVLIYIIKDPGLNIEIAAEHLADIKENLFPGKSAEDLTDDELLLIATAYNRGPDLSLEELKKNTSHGQAVLKHLPEVKRALAGEAPPSADEKEP